jgi:4-amino-4-deoxy-L-arabinose transferase-like glycosyltransferase
MSHQTVSDLRRLHIPELFGFLAIYGTVMMVFAAVTVGWCALHPDMTEAWAWGKEFQLGYSKHPPIMAWVTGGWFQLMPRTNWSFHLLAIVNAGIGLAGVWMLAGLLLGARGRWAAVLFLVLTPSYTWWALKFNAIAILLSSWPWAAYFFLQSLRKTSAGWGVLAGLVGAIALLSKYYSIILFGTLAVAALLHPDRGRYFRSSVPYVTLATGLALVAPHIWWLLQADSPLDYAISKTQYSMGQAGEHTLTAIAHSYLCLGLGAGAFAVAFGREFWGLLKRTLSATREPEAAWLIWLAHGPALLTIAAYLVANGRFATEHLMPAFFAMPIAFLASSGGVVTARVIRRLALAAAAVWLPLLLGSPAIANYAFAHAAGVVTAPSQEVAVAATQVWRTLFDRPLRFVAGTEAFATAATFYSPDAPSYFNMARPTWSPWASPEQVSLHGIFIICSALDRPCIERAEHLIGGRPLRHAQDFAMRYRGGPAEPQSMVLFILPPADMDSLD